MLRINHVQKSFFTRTEEIPVITDLNLEVKKGEVYGFLGLNGAGKTTTVKMIVGLLFPDKGTITISKEPAGSITSRQMIGFMPEQPQFYAHLRADEVLELVGELFGIEKTEIAKRSKNLLKKVGLSQAAHLPTKKFSKGMHQRLAFAIALLNNPELLVLDEPLDGLDPLGRLDFKRLILDLKKTGKTVFFSSHILADVAELCDRVAIIHKGKVIAVGSPTELIGKQAKTLEEVFVERVSS